MCRGFSVFLSLLMSKFKLTFYFKFCKLEHEFFYYFVSLSTAWNVCIKSYSGPHFPLFERNTERYSVSLGIQFECGKMRTRITPNTGTFYAVIVKLSLTSCVNFI